MGGEAAQHGAVAVAVERDGRTAGQGAQQRVQPDRALLGAAAGGGVHAESVGRGVVGPGDHGRTGLGGGGVLGPVQGLRHADRRRVLLVGALEREQIGVDARHHDGDPLGPVEASEDLGDPARTHGVEGEEVAPLLQHRLVAVHTAPGLLLSQGREPVVVHALLLDLALLVDGDAVGLVAQGHGRAVHVADRERIAVGETGALVDVEGREEAGEAARRGVRVRQSLSGDAAVLPRGAGRLERGCPSMALERGPATGGQHHEHHGQREQCAPDVQLGG